MATHPELKQKLKQIYEASQTTPTDDADDDEVETSQSMRGRGRGGFRGRGYGRGRGGGPKTQERADNEALGIIATERAKNGGENAMAEFVTLVKKLLEAEDGKQVEGKTVDSGV